MAQLDVSGLYAKFPDLQKDAQWKILQERFAFQLSDEGLNDPGNAFRDYLGKVKKGLSENLMVSLAEQRGYVLVGGGYAKKGRDNNYAPITNEDLSSLIDEANQQTTQKLAKHKALILENAAAGYKQQEPMPAGEAMLKGAVDGAVGEAMNLNFGGIVGGFIGGLMSSAKQFVLSIPLVGKFMRQVNNWASSQMSTMFAGKGEKAISWEKAGRLADAQKISDNIEKGLKVFSGLDVASVKAQVAHGMTFGFPAAPETRPVAPESSAAPAETASPEPSRDAPSAGVPPARPAPDEETAKVDTKKHTYKNFLPASFPEWMRMPSDQPPPVQPPLRMEEELPHDDGPKPPAQPSLAGKESSKVSPADLGNLAALMFPNAANALKMGKDVAALVIGSDGLPVKSAQSEGPSK